MFREYTGEQEKRGHFHVTNSTNSTDYIFQGTTIDF